MNTQLIAAEYIEKLLRYGIENELIYQLDIPQIRNQLMDLLNVIEPYQDAETVITEELKDILLVLLDYAVSIHLIRGTITERDLLDSKIMAQLLPRQSEISRIYEDLQTSKGKISATDYFYRLCQSSNYIRMDRIIKNLHWITSTEYGDMEITVNLSKPEKDPTEIAAQKDAPMLDYPRCLLCLENVGYAGRLNHPGRSNHRVLPITLDKETWYFQYSPYVYYNEHAIIFSELHRPMSISRKTFVRVLDFVEQLPHYFIGSNADLPIVGGSILSHDHFQGGHHVFPMEKAGVIKEFSNPRYRNTKIKMIKWPLSVIRLTSNNKNELIDLATSILDAWRQYNDTENSILSHTGEVPHNTITPIARINVLKEWELDLTLRNNRTNETCPDGIFHPHQHLHHIKKENIGLIEVMGLAVLPPRLEQEMVQIEDVLTGRLNIEEAVKIDSLQKHALWMRDLVERYGTNQTEEIAKKLLREEVGKKFTQVLECSGVFKQDQQGLEAFEKFINLCVELK
ncbi:MAG: galactose-1-phosphate uridylyltransferase [Firmicutes bacterium HGW-Firmicutes-1]|jgi:UDPglucose--hexose-1-phosphate uridylyltransferase|nr:MAG: galactose-1-phosphate uridylyltransferase [Firmicutes bacterium HGW-Firmicutes-1]